MIIWESKFEELAKYNADKDKSKYTQEYRRKMLRLQDEYNARLCDMANIKGCRVL